MLVETGARGPMTRQPDLTVNGSTRLFLFALVKKAIPPTARLTQRLTFASSM